MDLYRYYSDPDALIGGSTRNLVPDRIMISVEQAEHRNRHYRLSPQELKSITSSPFYSYRYAIVQDQPFPEGEAVIAQNGYYAAIYARRFLNAAWPEAEPAIAQDPEGALIYAQDVLKAPWPMGEAAIAQDANSAFLYAVHVLKAPFPAGEPAIAQDPWAALEYAREILKRPWPRGEPAIFSNPSSKWAYWDTFDPRRNRP